MVQASRIGMCAVALVAAVGVLGGCTATPRSQGKTGVIATYYGRTLKAELPASARVPAVIAAAEQTFRSRGYAVQEKIAAEEVGSIIGIPPSQNDFPRMLVRATRGTEGTTVELVYQPLGEERISRSILDGILQQLGL